MLGRLPAKGLLAIAAAVIAGIFIALLVTSRGPTDAEQESRDELAKYGAEQQARIDDRACADAVDRAVTAAADYLVARYGEGAADAIRQITRHRCEADHWAAPVTGCLSRALTDRDMQRCIGQLADHQRLALEAEMKAFAERPPPVDAAGDADDLAGDPYGADRRPYACVEYELLVTRVMSCEKLPQATRAAMKQALEAMRSGWTDLATMPQEGIDAMDTACREGVNALNQAAATICGW